MTRRTRLVILGALTAGIVALLVVVRQRDDTAPASKPAAQQEPTIPPGKPRDDRPAFPLGPSAENVVPHGLAALASAPEPPTSGPDKLQWLRIKRGHTYAAIALAQDQLAALRAVSNPSVEQREILARVPGHIRELEEKARQQEEEIEAFDINAPSEIDDPSPRTGPPIKVSAALSLKHEQWSALAAQHFGPDRIFSEASFAKLERLLKDEKDALALRIPAGSAETIQQEFVLVLDALIQSETMADRAAAEKLLAVRWEEFMKRIRASSAGRIN